MNLFIVVWLAVGANVFPALAQVPFYQDKTITVILGGPQAGSADLRTRSLVNILRKHIPGNPNIVMQYMAGGGRQAANHVYKVAKPDGLTVGSMGAALVANAVLGEPGVQYDLDKLVYLGIPIARSIISLLPTETPVPRTSTSSALRPGCASAGSRWVIRFTLPGGCLLICSV